MNPTSINPHRLYKNPQRGFIAGVCAGLADYFDISLAMVRIIFVLGFFISAPVFLFGYLILALALKRRPSAVFVNNEEETFWRSVSFTPRDTFVDLRHKIRTMEAKLRRMEDHVTSSEFELESRYKREM
ncbi:MAG: envelope stress response membrane protein PspC [Deltaproteobacteria bacterium]|nr:envelope stress response membrane protein PspC [Deltaproteobacteria bacterium]